MATGPAPFYVDKEADHDEMGASLGGLHYREVETERWEGVSYCGRPVELAGDIEIEMTEAVCHACREGLRAAHPRAFIPPGGRN